MPFDESKGEGKGRDRADSYDAKEAKRGGVNVLERGELLMYVADEARTKLFGSRSRLQQFVRRVVGEWDVAAEGHRTGEGSPLKQMPRFKSIHGEYMAIMDEELSVILAKNGGTLEQFMDDARAALAGGDGFLFEEENYSDFLELLQSWCDFECFHQMMIKEASKGMDGHAVSFTSDRK